MWGTTRGRTLAAATVALGVAATGFTWHIIADNNAPGEAPADAAAFVADNLTPPTPNKAEQRAQARYLDGSTINTASDRRNADGTPAPGNPKARYEGPGSHIANHAGLANPSALRNSESITVTEDGTTVENRNVDGVINIRANNVTIRNVRVTTTGKSGAINVAEGFSGTVVENTELHMASTDLNGSSAGVAGNGDHAMTHCETPGDNITVRRTFVYGNADGFKAANCSLYEQNYTRVYKLPNSPMHIDGIQGSGVSRVIVQNNFFDQMIAPGQNAAIFFQAFTGKKDKDVADITVTGNYVSGGTHPIKFSDGKKSTGRMTRITVADNHFLGQWRYAPFGGNVGVAGNLGKLMNGQVATNSNTVPPF